MKLSIIICVFNEVSTIEEVYREVANINLLNNIEKEIIIIDNHSSDGTTEILKTIKKEASTKIIYQNKNFGKGNSIIEGIKKASGDLVIFQDADKEYSPQNYNKLLEKLLSNNLDAVFGSRILENKNYHLYTLNKIAVVLLTNLINFLYGAKFTDTATNHKLIKTEVLKKLELKSKSFALDFEIALKLAKFNYSYSEVPIIYKSRKYKDGKKISYIDAFKSFFVIIYNKIT